MIDPRYYGLIEMAMTFFAVGGFVVHQFWTLRDKPSQDDEDADGN